MPLSNYLDAVPQLAERVYVHDSAQVIGSVRLGADSSIWCNAVLRGDVNDIVIGSVRLGADSSIWCNAVLRGDVNDIVIGRCTNIQDLTMGHVSHKTPAKPNGSPLVIGDYVTVGHAVILHGSRIGNECLIGMGTIVMDDVVVEDRVMVGAGSLVPPGKTLESGFLYVGRPVVKVRALTEAEIAYLRYSAEHYVRVKDNYLNGPAR